MIKRSSKYNMAYYNIKQLETRLNRPNIATSLWSIPKSKLQATFSDIIQFSPGATFNFLKDIHPEKSPSGDIQYRGLFVVCCDKSLTESEMQILLTQYLTENPSIDRSLPTKTNSEAVSTTSSSLSYNNPIDEDLNLASENLEQDNRVFGVLDDINHLDALSKIEGIDIIKNFGDFKKVYFSIPSFRQDEALAHSVTILKQIKCKRSLMDFIIN